MYRSKVSFLCMDPWHLFLNIYKKRSRGSIHPKQALDLYILKNLGSIRGSLHEKEALDRDMEQAALEIYIKKEPRIYT